MLSSPSCRVACRRRDVGKLLCIFCFNKEHLSPSEHVVKSNATIIFTFNQSCAHTTQL